MDGNEIKRIRLEEKPSGVFDANKSETIEPTRLHEYQKQAIWRQYQDQKSKAEHFCKLADKTQLKNTKLERFTYFLQHFFEKLSFESTDIEDKKFIKMLFEGTQSENTTEETIISDLSRLWEIVAHGIKQINPSIDGIDSIGIFASLEARISSLTNTCSEYEKRISETEEQLWLTERRARRLELELLHSKHAQPLGKKTNGTIDIPDEKEAPDNFQIRGLAAEISGLHEIAAQRLAELESTDEERRRLKSQLFKFKDIVNRIPPSVLEDPRSYEYVYSENRKFKEELRQREFELERIGRELEESDQRQMQLFKKLEEDMNSRKEGLRSLTETLENDCNRLRRDRDQMRQMYEQSNAQVGSQAKVISNLQQSLALLQTQYETLQEESDRLGSISSMLTRFTKEEFSNGEKLSMIQQSLQELEGFLIGEIEILGKTLDELRSLNQELIKSAEKQDKNYNQLLGEKLRLEFNLTQLQRDTDVTKMKAAKLEQEALTLANKSEEREKQVKNQYLYVEKELKEKRVQLEQTKWKLSEVTAQLSQLRVETEAYRSGKILDELAERQQLNDKLTFEKNRLLEELKLVQKKLEVYSTSSAPVVKDLKEEVEIYKKLLKCNACHTKDKDTVLSKCMHVFCRTCIDTRIETRQRKCPNCGESFGANDVKTIYL